MTEALEGCCKKSTPKQKVHYKDFNQIHFFCHDSKCCHYCPWEQEVEEEDGDSICISYR